jgi:hypothetical protein
VVNLGQIGSFSQLYYRRLLSSAAAMQLRLAALLALSVRASSSSLPPSPNATLVLLDSTDPSAVSLDGSPGSLYVTRGAVANMWVILQRGGGWCESDADCAVRGLTPLGSTKGFPPELNFDVPDPKSNFELWPMLSSDQPYNPFYNWSACYLPYTDGGSQVGDLDEPVKIGAHTVYYRGARIRRAASAWLLANTELSSATDVVITGGSAGALSTFLHADEWRAELPRTATVVAVPDSGFFRDWTKPSGPKSNASYHSIMAWVATRMNASLPAACVGANPADPTRCIFAEHVAPTLATPFFPLQSRYDAYQIVAELGSQNPAEVNAYGTELATVLIEQLITAHPTAGVFLDSCYHHTRYWGNITIDGDVAAQALESWYRSIQSGTPAKRVWHQQQPYPCARCCENGQ